MRDLKQRLFDLLRSGGSNSSSSNNNSNNNSNSNSSSNHSHRNGNSHVQHPNQMPAQKPKKLHEYTAADCNAAFLRKYHDLSISRDRELERERDKERGRERERAGAGAGAGNGQIPNVIYFNENLSMASKYNVRPFPLTRYPSCPLSTFELASSHESQAGRNEGSAGSSLGEDEEDTESEAYNFCSDEDQSSQTQTLKLRRHHHHNSEMVLGLEMGMGLEMEMGSSADPDPDMEDDPAESQLDSFCTLCTSTFSYNKCCRFCDNSLCGSKCNSERGSHASRMSRISQISRNLAPAYSADPEFDHQQQQQQQHRFGANMQHHQPAAIR
ncbi:hypothetical protein KR009_006860 [Drosophila setifemur]|nr:hypothetical protein KR009_006860 [Drosophila setifemur]